MHICRDNCSAVSKGAYTFQSNLKVFKPHVNKINVMLSYYKTTLFFFFSFPENSNFGERRFVTDSNDILRFLDLCFLQVNGRGRQRLHYWRRWPPGGSFEELIWHAVTALTLFIDKVRWRWNTTWASKIILSITHTHTQCMQTNSVMKGPKI